MKMNRWTVGLTTLGVVSLASAVRAEEKLNVVNTTLSATTLSGYVDTSAEYNPGAGTKAVNVPGYGFNSPKMANGFNLDVVDLTLEHPLTEGDWAAGYKVDLWMGPYASMLNTASPFSLGASQDFAIKQAYAALRVPVGTGINIKMGVFDSILGYESTASGANPNFTRSYGWTIEPTTFTGLLATYNIAENVAASAGVANTYGPTINQRPGSASLGDKAPSYLTWMGSIAVTAPKDTGFLEGSALYAGIVNGFNSASPGYIGQPNSNGATGQADQTSYYVGATLNTPIKELKVGFAYDYVSVSGQPLTMQTAGYYNSVAGYVSYQATEKLSLHGRAEYATHGGPSLLYLSNGTTLPGKVLGLTATVQYDLWANVLSRLEFRFDRDLLGENAYAGDFVGMPTRQNAAMVALNVIYKF